MGISSDNSQFQTLRRPRSVVVYVNPTILVKRFPGSFHDSLDFIPVCFQEIRLDRHRPLHIRDEIDAWSRPDILVDRLSLTGGLAFANHLH